MHFTPSEVNRVIFFHRIATSRTLAGKIANLFREEIYKEFRGTEDSDRQNSEVRNSMKYTLGTFSFAFKPPALSDYHGAIHINGDYTGGGALLESKEPESAEEREVWLKNDGSSEFKDYNILIDIVISYYNKLPGGGIEINGSINGPSFYVGFDEEENPYIWHGQEGSFSQLKSDVERTIESSPKIPLKSKRKRPSGGGEVQKTPAVSLTPEERRAEFYSDPQKMLSRKNITWYNNYDLDQFEIYQPGSRSRSEIENDLKKGGLSYQKMDRKLSSISPSNVSHMLKFIAASIGSNPSKSFVVSQLKEIIDCLQK